MGFYNPLIPIINIIKKFLYFISKKIFILLFIIIFLAFFIILSFINESKAVLIETTDYNIILTDTPVVNTIYQDFKSRDWYYGGIIIFKDNNNNYHVVGTNKEKFSNYFSNNYFSIKNDSGTSSTIKICAYNSNGQFTGDYYESISNGFEGVLNTSWGLSSNYIYSDYIIKDTNNNIIYPINYEIEVQPYIFTSTASIENWSFDNLVIKGNIDIRHNNEFFKTLILKLIINDYTYSQFIDTNYISYLNDNISNGNDWTITIPKNQLFNNLFNSEANLLDRNFILNVIDSSENEDIDYDLGTYDITLTQQQLNDINGQNNFNQQQQLQQDITNPNISSDFSNSNGGGFRDFSDGMEIQDNTSINSMFNMIYNAFTTQYGWNGSGQEPYELELTLPISNQIIKISPYTIYGRNWYTDNDNTAITIIKTLLNMFWWYIIGSFVVKDIRNTINKVAEGNIENASSDIKKELL